ncbi:SMI1/KNR4 family protein [Bremerella sp. JC817]|uniref:SMI1/KNR4 family protein n=1 Tax=Bremerella sp. JC817 TaxID=3231756 RepID=UPI0034580D28
MTAELKSFSKLVVPPSEPMYTNEDWQQVERSLGIELPKDYKQFISVYGSGTLQSFLHILNYSDPRIPAQQITDTIFSQLKSVPRGG